MGFLMGWIQQQNEVTANWPFISPSGCFAAGSNKYSGKKYSISFFWHPDCCVDISLALHSSDTCKSSQWGLLRKTGFTFTWWDTGLHSSVKRGQSYLSQKILLQIKRIQGREVVGNILSKDHLGFIENAVRDLNDKIGFTWGLACQALLSGAGLLKTVPISMLLFRSRTGNISDAESPSTSFSSLF